MKLLPAVAREALRLPDRAARALVLRDLDGWLRLQFLGVAARTGVADALPGTAAEVAERVGAVDVELLESFLRVGCALGEVREGYAIRGRRLRAVAGASSDLRGLVEELVAYDSPIYSNLEAHLRGAPKGDYLHGLGDVIARASRLAQPVLAPVVRSVVREAGSVLDVGCGTGVYLDVARAAAPGATVVGIDIDPGVAAGRDDVRCVDLFALEGERFDVVLLLQNIYYWPPEGRSAVFAKLRELAPVAVVASAVAAGPPFNAHLDLALRVTEGNYRLPTVAELGDGLRGAGFAEVRVSEPVPRSGLYVAVASSSSPARPRFQ